jgi:hypothetical protein
MPVLKKVVNSPSLPDLKGPKKPNKNIKTMLKKISHFYSDSSPHFLPSKPAEGEENTEF